MVIRVACAAWMLSGSTMFAQREARTQGAPAITQQIAERYGAWVADSVSTTVQTRAAWQARLESSRDTIEGVLRWNDTHERSASSLRMLISLSAFWNGPALVAAFDEALAARTRTDSTLRSRALNTAALAAFRVGDQAKTRAWAREGAALSLALHDSVGAGRAYQRLVQAALRDGGHGALRALADTGQRLCQRDVSCQAYFVNMRGESARVLQQYDSAAVHYTRADSMYRSLSATPRLDISHNFGFTLLALGRTSEARQRFVGGLESAMSTNNRPYVAFFVAAIASAAASDRDATAAARLFGLSDAVLEQTGRLPDPADAVEYNRYRARARAQLGNSFDDLILAGRTMSIDSVLRAIHRP